MSSEDCIAMVVGPMRGHDNFNYPNFDKARKMLEDWGYNVVTPADLDRQAGFDSDGNWELTDEILRDRTRDSMTWTYDAEFLVMLPGWKSSKGTLAEVGAALARGARVFETDYENLYEWHGSIEAFGRSDSKPVRSVGRDN